MIRDKLAPMEVRTKKYGKGSQEGIPKDVVRKYTTISSDKRLARLPVYRMNFFSNLISGLFPIFAA